MAIKEVSFALSNALGVASVNWKTGYGEPDIDKQNDAVFYQGEDFIAEVSYQEFSIDIYCDGDMKFRHKENGETWLRTTSDLADFGIGTEEELRDSNEKELLNWDMNPWFDLYIDGEHMDCVSETLSEALSLASAYVVKQHAEAELLMGIDIF